MSSSPKQNASPSGNPATGTPRPSSNGKKPKAAKKQVSLAQWVHTAIGLPQIRVQSRTRGNALYVLCEGDSCPELAIVLPRLLRAIATNRLEKILSIHQPQLYQIVLYGRAIGVDRPAWTETIQLNQLDRYLERWGIDLPPTADHLKESSTGTPQSVTAGNGASAHSSMIVSNVSLARQGNPDAIARYLSETLSNLGVAIQVSVKAIPWTASSGDWLDETDPKLSAPESLSAQRLQITCESAYTPDTSLLAEPIAQRLRQLQLEGFRDAIVVSQVFGETKPDWILRVDLTPRDEMLREWARWGDVQALTRLLGQALADQGIKVSTSLKDLTLHITCTLLATEQTAHQEELQAAPDKARVMAVIAPLMETIAPQGIHAATVYGFKRWQPDDSPQRVQAPLWVDWLDLPATIHPALAPSTLTLAQQGDRAAIVFLLTRLINANLDAQLATGGIRVQTLHKGDLLHIMTDAPTCPDQRQIGKPIARLLRPLQIPGVSGVRVYGRRAGQKRPLWSYGVDFARRDRVVPEATPEFAASDAYIGDLLSKPGALILRPDLPADDLQSTLARLIQQAGQTSQQWLLRSKLFTSADDGSPLPGTPDVDTATSRYQGAKLAMIWGALGLVLTLQTDWLIGHLLYVRSHSPAPKPSQTAAPRSPSSAASSTTEAQELPKLSLRKTPGNNDAFNPAGFTGSGNVSVIVDETGNATTRSGQGSAAEPGAEPFPASPLQPLADPLPQPGTANAPASFNSRQLDEKLALYRDRIAVSGVPDVMVIGSSRALRGVDPVALEKALANLGYRDIDVFNFGINGATAQVVNVVIREILAPEELPKLIVWADGARAFNSGRVDITYNAIAVSKAYKQLAQAKPSTPERIALPPSSPATTVETVPAASGDATSVPTTALSYQAVNQWLDQLLAKISPTYQQRDQLKTVVRETASAALPKSKAALPPSTIADNEVLDPSVTDLAATPNPSIEAAPGALPGSGRSLIDINGFLPLSNRFNPVTYYQKYARVSGDFDSDYESFELQGKQIIALNSLMQYTRSRQIPVVFVNLPLTQVYLDPVRQEYETQFQQEIRLLATEKKFTYVDLSQAWMTKNDYYSDPSHLNRYGAYAVSQRLAQTVLIPWGQLNAPQFNRPNGGTN